MHGMYGFPPRALAAAEAEAVQFSPLVPQSRSLEDSAPASLRSLVMLAPPGTLERRYALALALRALSPGGRLTVMALNTRGGTRLKDELAYFGCAAHAEGRQHYRLCACTRPEHPQHLKEAVAAGGLQRTETGLWSQPGVFSWNRIDPGSALLAAALPAFSGKGADLGAGNGYLARAALASPAIESLTLVDVDRRAVEAAQKNVTDARAHFLWSDARALPLAGLDFVIMNPPFHEAGMEYQPLGQQFTEAAARALRPGGSCWLVANRHLPYEATLRAAFAQVLPRGEAGGYKLFEARR